MFDTVGILVLSLLIALFGFVTFRAWRLRRRSLRWVGVAGGGLFTLMLSAGLVLGLIGFYKLNEQHSNPVANIHVAGTAA